MKKLFTLLMLGASLNIGAQHLPNVGFDNWKGSGKAGSTYQSSKAGMSGSTNAGLRQRPGDEPVDWFGSSINQKVMGFEKQQELIYSVSQGNNIWAKLVNTFVGMKIGSTNIGSNAPAYLTFGTPWVYAVSDVSKCDGGTYGGVAFTEKPDALVGKYKKTPVATAENSYIVAYIWNGTFKSQIASTSTADADKIKDDVDRAILGSQTGTGFASPSVVSQQGNLIAYCNKQFVSTENDDWELIEVPMTYIEANKDLVPEKMNVVICAGDYKTRGNLQDGTTLEVDDVDFVYWNTLSSLKYDGSELLNGEATSYSVDAEYDAAKLVATAKSQFAEVTTSYDESTAITTVTVKRENADDKIYTIQFKMPVTGPSVVNSETYTEPLYVCVDGQFANPQNAGVLVETLDNGHINFVLKNFALGEGEDSLPIGNIAVDDLEVDADGNFSFEGDIEIVEGEDTDVDGWFGPMLGEIPLNMKGVFAEGQVYVDIDIDMQETIGQTIIVHLGNDYVGASMAVSADAHYGTFFAPFDVVVPGEVDEASTATLNGKMVELTSVGEVIPANTPVILYSEYGMEAVTVYGKPVAGTPTVGCLTGVLEPTPITEGYVLQNQNGKVGFYQVTSSKVVSANRAYLTAPAGVKAFYFAEDADGIEKIDAVQNSKLVYDLQGRRVENTQKGVFIMNGKKVVR